MRAGPDVRPRKEPPTAGQCRQMSHLGDTVTWAAGSVLGWLHSPVSVWASLVRAKLQESKADALATES